jgi:hypothetical protein
MQVIMPDILVARWFIMLAQRNSIAVVDCFHGKGNIFGTCMNIRTEGNWKIIDIFVMFVRNYQHMSEIIGHVVQTHKSGHGVVLENRKCVFTVCNFTDDTAEDAIVFSGAWLYMIQSFCRGDVTSPLLYRGDQLFLQWQNIGR